ncbi:MAG TPA: PEGA domain-containing protein [Candidatus Nanoarchaeia archaeon]|nr:PEGA domain-containing protein [Candidatus Nanoarchaeia archaeon]
MKRGWRMQNKRLVSATLISLLVFILTTHFASGGFGGPSKPPAQSNISEPIKVIAPQPAQQVVTSQPAQQDLPVIETFTVQPSTIKPGECTYIYWTVKKADSVASNFGSINSPTSPGSREFSNAMQTCPTQTTTYTITATTKQGTNKTATTTIQVTTPQPKVLEPSIKNFYANPNPVAQGQCSNLYWSVIDVEIVTTNFGHQDQPLPTGIFEGSTKVCPSQTTNYTIIAKTKNGIARISSTSLQVNPKAETTPTPTTTQPTTRTTATETTPTPVQPTAPVKKAPVYGSLDIASNPGDASIFINEKYRGNTPASGYASIDLETGSYDILIKKDSLSYKTTMKIEVGMTYTLNPKLS